MSSDGVMPRWDRVAESAFSVACVACCSSRRAGRADATDSDITRIDYTIMDYLPNARTLIARAQNGTTSEPEAATERGARIDL
ncbi:hypothetical protein GCM10009780_42270 [Actinomadura alba]